MVSKILGMRMRGVVWGLIRGNPRGRAILGIIGESRVFREA